MKLVYKRIDRDGSGEVKLTAEIAEDMWCAPLHAFYFIVGVFTECRRSLLFPGTRTIYWLSVTW